MMHSLKNSAVPRTSQQQHLICGFGLRPLASISRRRGFVRTNTSSPSPVADGWYPYNNSSANSISSNNSSNASVPSSSARSQSYHSSDTNNSWQQQQQQQQQPHSSANSLSASWRISDGSGSAGSSSSRADDNNGSIGRGTVKVSGAAALLSLLIAFLDAVASSFMSALDNAANQLQVAMRRARRVAAELARPESRLLLEGCQLGASLLFILLYVWSTYSPAVAGGPRWWLDLVLSAVFAADYTHRILVSSSHPLLAVLHPLAMIDLLSWAPSLLGVLLPACQVPWGLDLRWFRVFRALRLLRLSLLSGNLSTMKSNRGALVSGSMNVPLVWLFASVIAWLFTSASCVAVMEKWVWHDALYFVTSTLTTVGYGDVVVKSSMGRLVVLVMMLIGVVLIPVRAGQLYSKLQDRSLVAGPPPGDAPGCRGAYVVLSGRLSDVRGFNDFLQDFLVQVRGAPGAGAARGRGSLQLVCLCNKPSAEFLALQELHESHLSLIEGSAFSERDLINRAALAGSAGVMVLADRFSTNAAAEDTDVQFRVWAIKSAVKRLPLYVQVLRRESVAVISPFLDPAQDVISSIEGTRLRLLALSCFVPGASTLIANLIRSSGPNASFAGGPRHARHSSSVTGSPTATVASLASVDDILRSRKYGGTWDGTSSVAKLHQPVGLSSRDGSAGYTGSTPASDGGYDVGSMAGRRWLREYADGAHCELFWCAAGAPLAGLRFSEVAGAMYQATGVLPVGIVQEPQQRLLLNPSSAVIQQGQQLIILATTGAAAAAGAAGDGVEHTQIMQSLRAAAITAATTCSSSSDAGHLHKQHGPEYVNAASSSSVTVRVPGLLVQELAHFVSEADRDHAASAQSSHHDLLQKMQRAARSARSRSTSSAASSNQPQQQQHADRSDGQLQGADGAAIFTSAHSHVSRDLISQPGSCSGGIILDDDEEYLDGDLALLNPCLANWSGACESDSVDETDMCTDNELQDAVRLQRQRQQLQQQKHQQQQQQHQQARLLQSSIVAKQEVISNGSELGGAADTYDFSSSSSSSQQEQGLPGYGDWPQQQQGTPKLPSLHESVYYDRQEQWQRQRQFFGNQPLSPPKELQGHVIIAGSSSEFLPFAEQLHAIAPPESAPVTIVVLHTEPPPDDIYQEVSNLGPTYYVRGKPSESAALAAAGAAFARSLIYLGPSERPTHLSSLAVSGVYGDPTSREVNPADYNSTSRTAVLADADALSSCYGVGEVLLPDILHTVVELGFTSSINFLQPGLLLHGRSAPRSLSSLDTGSHTSSLPGLGILAKLKDVLHVGRSSSTSSSTRQSSRLIRQGSGSQWRATSSKLKGHQGAPHLHAAASRVLGASSSRNDSPSQHQHQHQHQHYHNQPRPRLQQQQHSKQPRSSWRHRKEIEDAGREEGLTEWQLNSYYAAGRVMVPALLDTFTCQGFFKRKALLDLMTELAGDDGRPGGAMLRQVPVPECLVGATYKELVEHFTTACTAHERYIPLGLIRRKSENRAWRLPYVATHPDPDAVLQTTDAVFVIRPQ